MHLRIGRAVFLLMVFGEREALNHFARVVQAENVGAGAHAKPVDLGTKAQIAQDMLGVGADLDASADLAQLRRLLVDLDLMARLHQAGRSRQTAKAGAGDDDLALFHLPDFLTFLDALFVLMRF